MRRFAAKWILLTMTLSAWGCASSAEEPGDQATAGEENAKYAGPIGSDDVAAGQELFSLYCDDCHPDGGEDVGPSLIAEPHTPAELRQQIREGSGRMRPFSENRISADELEQLLAYLQSINATK